MVEEKRKFLTVEQTREILCSSRKFVYNLVDRGDLDIHKVGRRSYFQAEQVDGLFKKKKANE